MAEVRRKSSTQFVIQAALVTHVEPGSPAERAGLAISDVILGYNNQPTVSAASLRDFVRGCRPDSVIHLSYLRGSNPHAASVTISASPYFGGANSPFAIPVSAEDASAANQDVNGLRQQVQQMERRIRALENLLDERER